MSQNAQDRYPKLANADGQLVDGIIYSKAESQGLTPDCKKAVHDAGLDENKLCFATHCIYAQNSQTFQKNCHEHQANPYWPVPSSHCIRISDQGKTIEEVYYPRFSGTTIDDWNSRVFTDCFALAGRDGTWRQSGCSCCCSCYAYDTPISAPDGMRMIQDFKVGDLVLAGSPLAEGADKVNWTSAEITFSAGTGPGGINPAMMYIRYGDRKLIVTPDQLFLMPDGKLKRADRLVDGVDQLVLADGGTIVARVEAGTYYGGVHHIATSNDFDGKLDKHLLNSNGIITGDFTLQIHQEELEQSKMMDVQGELPVYGTDNYMKQLRSGDIKEAGQGPAVRYENFMPYGIRKTYIPEHAKRFFTEKQAEDILQKKYNEASDIFAKGAAFYTNYLFKIFSAFYPDIWFYLDWEANLPNAYSFEEYGHKVVIVNGGLVRIDGFTKKGLYIVIAHEIGHLIGEEPKDVNEYSCTGEADYYGVGVILRNVLYPDEWFSTVDEGMEQIQMLFDLIKPNHQGENPLEKCIDPSLKCRIRAMQAAIVGGNLPQCAGGTVEQKDS